MLKGIHFLLTYECNYACDHCFLYCSPNSKGTFTLAQIKQVLEETVKIGTVEWIFLEGGEPFLYYPIMLEAIRQAYNLGFKTGIVTNSYWATSVEDAKIWLKPIAEIGISDFSISNDTFHYETETNNLSKIAKKAAKELNLPSFSICIEEPTVKSDQEKGEPVIGGGAMFRGRAIDTLLSDDLPRRSWEEMIECPYEDLEGLGRVHVDPFGNVHICQGLSIGNLWEVSLSELIKNYNPDSHPICRPLLQGGPSQLVREYNIEHEDQYVDECHLCYLSRLKLLDEFPNYLAPRQVYGID